MALVTETIKVMIMVIIMEIIIDIEQYLYKICFINFTTNFIFPQE